MEQEQPDEVTRQAIEEYSKTIAPNEIIEEGNFNTNVDTIREYIADYIANTKERPTIIIDYLQILTPSNTKYTDKQQMDYNVKILKQTSRDYNIPIIVISSFNRANYNQEATLEAFKESGGIEYTADVVLGLQFRLLADADLKLNKNGNLTKEAKEQINAEFTKTPRELQLVCLKNRNGKSFFKVDLNYYSAFNYFIEKKEDDRKHNRF